MAETHGDRSPTHPSNEEYFSTFLELISVGLVASGDEYVISRLLPTSLLWLDNAVGLE
jgi:hypothetical protein